VACTGLTEIVNIPTRGQNKLDRIYVNNLCYKNIRVVISAVKSDHKAVVAYTGATITQLSKQREVRLFTKRSPAQHAAFLGQASSVKFSLSEEADVQTNFDAMYESMHSLLNQFYPERSITITTADPQYVTPAIKAMLRRKNRLMRSGRTDEAGAIAERIRHHITCYNSTWLRNTDKKDPRLHGARHERSCMAVESAPLTLLMASLPRC
jgi:hypothetical protein